MRFLLDQDVYAITTMSTADVFTQEQVRHAGLPRSGREATVSSRVKKDQGAAMGVLRNHNHLQIFSHLQVADL
jgi:hypothetical protein